MSGWLDPVGPLPPAVYWRRRIVAVAVLLVVLLLLWWLVFGRGGSASGGGASPTVSPSPTSSTSPSPSPSTSPSVSPTAEPTQSPDPDPSPTADAPPCADSAIVVAASADPNPSVTGGQMVFTLSITNASDASCMRDIGPRANELQVSVGNDRLWSSDDCNASKEPNKVILAAGEAYVTEATWDQQTSTPGCQSSVPVSAGVYEVYGRNGDVISEATLITIEAAPAEGE